MGLIPKDAHEVLCRSWKHLGSVGKSFSVSASYPTVGPFVHMLHVRGLKYLHGNPLGNKFILCIYMDPEGVDLSIMDCAKNSKLHSNRLQGALDPRTVWQMVIIVLMTCPILITAVLAVVLVSVFLSQSYKCCCYGCYIMKLFQQISLQSQSEALLTLACKTEPYTLNLKP